MTNFIVIAIALFLFVINAIMILKVYLRNHEQERKYKKAAKNTRSKRKEFEKRKRKQFENNKLDKDERNAKENFND